MKLKKCAALLLVSSCLLTGCTTSSAKKVDSKYVVASLEKGNKTKNIFADNLYKDIIDNSSNNSTVFNAVLQNLVDQKFPVNDDMKEDAATIIKQIKSAYKSNYGDNYKDSLNQALTSAGYKNLSEYRQKMIKQIQYANFLLDYIDDHFDDVFNDFPFYEDKAGQKIEKKLYGRHGQNLMKTDIKEMEDGYELEMDLPGFKKEEISISLEDGNLTIQAAKGLDEDEKEKKSGRYIRRERYAGSCARSFYVGDDITEEDIKAEFKHGILKIFVPKKEAKPEVEQKKYIAIEG